MQIFVRKPSVELFSGIKVTKDTEFTYWNDNVKQELHGLVFHSVTKVKGENFESTYDTTIQLSEGDVLIFEEEGRGYIKPVEEFVSIAEAANDLTSIEDLR